jgi:hypothetical protein
MGFVKKHLLIVHTVALRTAYATGRVLYQAPGTLQAYHHVIQIPSISADHLDENRVKGMIPEATLYP